jgi:hypothetical protein
MGFVRSVSSYLEALLFARTSNNDDKKLLVTFRATNFSHLFERELHTQTRERGFAP